MTTNTLEQFISITAEEMKNAGKLYYGLPYGNRDFETSIGTVTCCLDARYSVASQSHNMVAGFKLNGKRIAYAKLLAQLSA